MFTKTMAAAAFTALAFAPLGVAVTMSHAANTTGDSAHVVGAEAGQGLAAPSFDFAHYVAAVTGTAPAGSAAPSSLAELLLPGPVPTLQTPGMRESLGAFIRSGGAPGYVVNVDGSITGPDGTALPGVDVAPMEDESGWDCVSDGNRICGPNNPEGKPAACYDDGGVIVALWPCHVVVNPDGSSDVYTGGSAEVSGTATAQDGVK